MPTRSKSAVSKAETPQINRKALLVAIDDYPGISNDLNSCVADAKAMTALLQTSPYNFEEIQTYTNEQATIANIKAGLEWLISNAASDRDRLVLFFSGHGFRTKKDGTDKDGVLHECLCLHDGFLFDTELTQLTQTLPPAILSIFLDCCHSGGMEKNFVLRDSKIKTFFPTDPQEIAKAFAPKPTSPPIKPFGCSTQFNPDAPANKEFKEPEQQVNGLIITACQAEQVALAGSPQTEGKSAFTYSLLKVLETLSPNAEVSNRQLFERTSAVLKSLHLEQIPVLHEPPNAPGLQDKSFITLRPVSVSQDSPAPVFPNFPTEPIETTNKGTSNMSTTQSSVLNLNRPLTEADAQFCTDVLKYSLEVMPRVMQSVNQQDSKANGQEPIGNSKFWGGLAVGSAIPYVLNWVQGKSWETEIEDISADEKAGGAVLGLTLAGVLTGIIPGVVSAFKGATDSKNLNRDLTEADIQYCTKVVECSLRVMPKMLQAISPQNSKAVPWGAAVPGLVAGIPGLIALIRGKDWKIESDAPITEEKFWADVLGATLGANPGNFFGFTKGVTDSKNFDPKESSAAPASNGATSAEVGEELVDAVMTRLASALLAAR
ncbi:MAG: caspase family protein [Nostocales cyanobacterium 94392]|nr:caspase family protein [Nostocales cyanobacterium 94392]